MKRFIFLIMLAFGLFSELQAQLVRYKDVVFANVKITTNVKYGSNIPFASNDPVDLMLDVYEPLGDTARKRPVIVLIHAGSFLNANLQGGRIPAGTKEDHWLKESCMYYAKRGYVAVALTHRLGWNPTLTSPTARARSIFEAVWRARQDLKAGIRFLNKEATTYKIDVNRIAAGGSSSGAYVALHAEYLNKPEELTYPKFLDEDAKAFIDTVKLGGFEGESGNPGFQSKIHALVCIGGAVGDTTFIEAGDPPVIASHGVIDQTTPYKTSMVVTATGNVPIIEVSGSHDLVQTSTRLGNQKKLIDAGFNDSPFPGLLPFENENFEFYNYWNVTPESEIAGRMSKLNTVLEFITPRLFSVLDLPTVTFDDVVSRSDLALQSWSIYPNPTIGSEGIIFHTEELNKIRNIELFEVTGRKVNISQENFGNSINITWDKISPGIYLLTFSTANQIFTEKIIIN